MQYIAVCDDEPVHLDYTQNLIQKILLPAQFKTDAFSSAEQLLQTMEFSDYSPDIAVLDICMDGFDGIELAKKLNQLAPKCKIIFLTSFLNYATEVYEADHIYFVLKSEMDHRLEPALQKAVNTPPALHYIQVKQAKGTFLIPLNEILFLERKGRKTRVQTESEELWTSQTPQELLSNIIPKTFIRCHQSYWVQTTKILAMKNNDFYLPNDFCIPLSRTYRQEAKTQFFASLKNPAME